MTFSTEMLIEIWDDQHGCKWEVGPDRDGLDLVEIRECGDGGKIVARITVPKECARLIAAALGKVTAE